ncbi:hypothetical protein QTQ03_20375 [Micromonospora sp. WMMA1363]|uniref:hypothetical protein n=1 Tax=Micromonospora sp. WMMA1363 TaxID=3053985 RepID=UPI00259C9E76|nr:hypothetical protein [Micromonospora sp. WMMA1363]MDM4721835.1 hypothetical protein [Micromonospora sp. WMMA1363]
MVRAGGAWVPTAGGVVVEAFTYDAPTLPDSADAPVSLGIRWGGYGRRDVDRQSGGHVDHSARPCHGGWVGRGLAYS